jgi:hypothetical protein
MREGVSCWFRCRQFFEQACLPIGQHLTGDVISRNTRKRTECVQNS